MKLELIRQKADVNRDEILVPPEFFKGLDEDDRRDIARRSGWLSRRLCRRLWRILKRTDPPPRTLQLLFSREDVMREFPPRGPRES